MPSTVPVTFYEAASGKPELLDAVLADDWDDIPLGPTGRQTEVRTHDFHQIADGRVVRTHHMEDWFSWFQQVGSWPSH
jgi:hypothetical protein